MEDTAIKEYPKDKTTKDTRHLRAYFNSEGEARQVAREKVGVNPVDIGNNKWRSQDGKWQYRAKPGDVADNHLHLEELHPQTGEVKQNIHLCWPEDSERPEPKIEDRASGE